MDFHLAQRQRIDEAIDLRHGELAEVIGHRQGHRQNHAGGTVEDDLEVALLQCACVGAGQRSVGLQVKPAIRRTVLVVRMQHQAAAARHGEVGRTAGHAQAVYALHRAERHAAGAGAQRIQRSKSAGVPGKAVGPSRRMVVKEELAPIGAAGQVHAEGQMEGHVGMQVEQGGAVGVFEARHRTEQIAEFRFVRVRQ